MDGRSTAGVCVAVTVSVGLAVLAVLVQQLHELQRTSAALLSPHDAHNESGCRERAPRVWVSGRVLESGHLKHVTNVFERLGFERGAADDYDVFWSHEYPFRIHREQMEQLKPGQKVNHFPGTGYITSKVLLATSDIEHVPKAFKMPDHADKLRQHIKDHPNKIFVQKSNTHRNVRLRSVSELDLTDNDTFVQEFVENPLLVDGHKFDIGVYAVLTSIDPLRVYVYWGDVLLRFCSEKYHPFNASNADQYVVGDHYVPVWQLPSLQYYHDTLQLGHRESLNAYLRHQGLEPQRIWDQIDESIRSVYVAKEAAMLRVSARLRGSLRQFFELVRFDFLVDDQLNVYLLEANMSPNLSSRHFRQNRLLYEQVVMSVLSVAGLAGRLRPGLRSVRTGPAVQMSLADKELAVFGQRCGAAACRQGCDGVCRVCAPCLTRQDRVVLRQAAGEHLDRHLCRRLLPPPLTSAQAAQADVGLDQLSPNNRLMYLWFRGKCLLDPSWC